MSSNPKTAFPLAAAMQQVEVFRRGGRKHSPVVQIKTGFLEDVLLTHKLPDPFRFRHTAVPSSSTRPPLVAMNCQSNFPSRRLNPRMPFSSAMRRSEIGDRGDLNFLTLPPVPTTKVTMPSSRAMSSLSVTHSLPACAYASGRHHAHGCSSGTLQASAPK